jgi:hypothetical protein
MSGATAGVLVAMVVSRNAIVERWGSFMAMRAAAGIVLIGLIAPMIDGDFWIYIFALGGPGAMMLSQAVLGYVRLGSSNEIAQPGQEMTTV